MLHRISYFHFTTEGYPAATEHPLSPVGDCDLS